MKSGEATVGAPVWAEPYLAHNTPILQHLTPSRLRSPSAHTVNASFAAAVA